MKSLCIEEYVARILVKIKLHYFSLIKGRLNEACRTLFHATCFKPWLDINYVDNDDGMIHYMLQKQCCIDDDNFDMPLMNGDIPFRNPLLPKKIGHALKIIEVLALIEDEDKFSKLSGEDAIRLCFFVIVGESSCEWSVGEISAKMIMRAILGRGNLTLTSEIISGRAPLELAPMKSKRKSKCKEVYPMSCGLNIEGSGREKGQDAALINRVRVLEGLCKSLSTLHKEVKSLRGCIFKL
ncbi:hypothetical protein Tco_1507224 [Tanacetum coccineum]